MLILSCYAPCRADRVVATRALAHLLAAHSIATPKQAKEPILTAALDWNEWK